MLYSAIILGLISSLHCIAMCGPIALMLPLDRNNRYKKATQLFTYHLGRLCAYSGIGLFFGVIGRGFYLAGIQQQIAIFAGTLMIIIVVFPERKLAKYNFSGPVYRILSRLRSSLGSQFGKKTYTSLFTIGVLNGFLPCGSIYAALFGALSFQNPGLSVIYMLLFGLGTIPLMTTLVYFHSFISLPVRNKIQKIIPYTIAGIGILFVLKGLGLGIPFLSPGNMLFIMANPDCH